MKYALVFFLIIAILILGPFLTIWSLNVLFPALNIGYGLNEWAAVILLASALRANISVNK
jgi:hypothetical protein